MIYHKLGKHKEAIVDLEFALRAFPKRARLHAHLASLYDQIGDPDLAAEHRRWMVALELEAIKAGS